MNDNPRPICKFYWHSSWKDESGLPGCPGCQWDVKYNGGAKGYTGQARPIMKKLHIVEKQCLPWNYGWQTESDWTKPFDTIEEAETHITKRIEKLTDGSRHDRDVVFRVTILYVSSKPIKEGK